MYHGQTGRLEVICGSMFSGKTEELLRRLRRAELAKKRVLTIKNHIDTRSGTTIVTSHNGNYREAHALENSPQMINLITELAEDADVIGLDEIQFFSSEIIAALRSLIAHGKRIIVAGLDLDFKGEPFTVVASLMAFADDVLKLSAICMKCGNTAHFTQRIINGEPASYYDPVILVGASEFYEARCRSCFILTDNPYPSVYKTNIKQLS